ncbi:MAG TPA: hypothetical protein VHB77_04735 [Planctomycetaceae bacterium]|nr:hypothetical protein [Planctomycetaceae bacterium]
MGRQTGAHALASVATTRGGIDGRSGLLTPHEIEDMFTAVCMTNRDPGIG